MLQAVLYFRRALRLDAAYLSAWTLMGHEYVELQNPPAAIGAHIPSFPVSLLIPPRASHSTAGPASPTRMCVKYVVHMEVAK